MNATNTTEVRGWLYLWREAGLYAGHNAVSRPHRHHAIQVTCALDVHSSVRAGPRHRWQDCAGFMVLPRHRFQAQVRGSFVTLFIDLKHPIHATFKDADPEGLIGGFGIPEFPPDVVETLARFHHTGRPVVRTKKMLMHEFLNRVGAVERARLIDPRVLAVIGFVDRNLRRKLRVAELARQVELSASRLMYLFRRETGVTIRQYILWRRVRMALVRVLDGHSVTDAAHAAAFSDSAHLARTFASMFGFSLTALFGRSRRPHFVLRDSILRETPAAEELHLR